MRLPKVAVRYKNELGLRWPVILEKGKEDALSIHTEVDAQKRKGKHIIFASKHDLKNSEFYRVDWAHILCHALLSEKIDPVFGSFIVVGKIEPEERQRRAEILFLAKAHEDLLVNDAREEMLGRDLTIEDCQTATQGLILIVEKAKKGNPLAKGYLTNLSLPWQIAIVIAQDERHQLELGTEKILKLFDNELGQYVKKILGVYRELPLLSWSNREKLLMEFEMSVQKVCVEILKTNFLPRMIDHSNFPGRKVWSVE